MLSLLKISNLALVDRLVWEPSGGLLAVTGETGAGKSVITGAIGLALGGRGDKSMIRSGEEQCSIEAVFRLKESTEIDALLEDAGLPPCEEGELLIRRVISANGNRQFINSSPTTLRVLREVGSRLADMSRADESASLMLHERQLELLDTYAENVDERQVYARSWQAYIQAKQALNELASSEQAQAREVDFLRHQIEEIEAAAFTAEETENIEREWQRAHHATRLRETALPLVHMLRDEDGGIADQMHRFVRGVRELERIDPTCPISSAQVEILAGEVEEMAESVEEYAERLDLDPAELARLEERIVLLDSLKRKYGSDFSAIETHLSTCRRKLDAIEHRDEELARLESELHNAEKELKNQGEILTASRRKAASQFACDMVRHVRELGFLQAVLEVKLLPEPACTAHGAESVEFLFGPNPGEPLQPLRSIASSGESARVMLAVKSALASRDKMPLLVFDEIDANVGGEIALAVGRKMSDLAKDRQVISITHFPQVAALAEHHHLIRKESVGGRTASSLCEVRGESRVDELVRMLGGGDDRTRAHARALLERGREKNARAN